MHILINFSIEISEILIVLIFFFALVFHSWHIYSSKMLLIRKDWYHCATFIVLQSWSALNEFLHYFVLSFFFVATSHSTSDSILHHASLMNSIFTIWNLKTKWFHESFFLHFFEGKVWRYQIIKLILIKNTTERKKCIYSSMM